MTTDDRCTCSHPKVQHGHLGTCYDCIRYDTVPQCLAFSPVAAREAAPDDDEMDQINGFGTVQLRRTDTAPVPVGDRHDPHDKPHGCTCECDDPRCAPAPPSEGADLRSVIEGVLREVQAWTHPGLMLDPSHEPAPTALHFTRPGQLEAKCATCGFALVALNADGDAITAAIEGRQG